MSQADRRSKRWTVHMYLTPKMVDVYRNRTSAPHYTGVGAVGGVHRQLRRDPPEEVSSPLTGHSPWHHRHGCTGAETASVCPVS